ncbi:PIN-like domain-containing protein [Bacillus cereus]
MNSQHTPKITSIIEESIIVFDTCALLNVYRYSLLSSKRLLDYIKKYEEKMWIPSQVRKEFYKNKGSVRSINLYKNLDKQLTKQVETKRDELLVQLSEYEKKRFPKFTELKSKLEEKFAEMVTITKDYKNEVVEETGVYKEFIEEVDTFIDSLLNSGKVGDVIDLVSLMEIIKEGELRYKYNLPPGFKDADKEEGIDKFGDLILWKEIIKRAGEISEKNIIFVTSDTKSDWFFKNKKNEIMNPREELISEFKHYHLEKEIIIIPFEDYIEEIANPDDSSDKDLLLELRMNNLIKRLPFEVFAEIVEGKIESLDIEDLRKKMNSNLDDEQRKYIDSIHEVNGHEILSVKVITNGIEIQNDNIVYSVNAIADCQFGTISYSPGMLNYGTLNTDIILGIELTRKLTESEVAFIKNFKENSDTLIKVTHFITDNEKFIWGNDFDLLEFEDDYYTTCGSCGEGINHKNDAGNGFCVNCPE